jgi:hypothetical protein
MNPGQFDRGYIQSWNFFLEREVRGGFTASAGPGAGPVGAPLAILFGRTVTTELHTPFGTANYTPCKPR